MFYSLSLILTFPAAVLSQGVAVPESCNDCFVVADIVQVTVAEYTSAKAMVQETLVGPVSLFEFNGGGTLSSQPLDGTYTPLTGTLITVNGVILTSPTVYLVVEGYTEFQETQVGASCVTNAIVSVALLEQSSYSMAPNADAIFTAESKFIAQLSELNCKAQGAVSSSEPSLPPSITPPGSSTSTLTKNTVSGGTTSSESTTQILSKPTSSSISSPDSELSQSTKIGVGIGVGVGGAVFVALLLAFIRRRRQVRSEGLTDGRYSAIEMTKEGTSIDASPGVAVDEPGISIDGSDAKP